MSDTLARQTASAADEPAHLLIRASAGTGKTYALSSRFLRLIADGCAPRRILATTFTRKAAGEILARVLSRLAEAVDRDDSRKALATSLGQPALTREMCLEWLTRLTRSVHQMRISTLDAFFTRLARSYGWRLQLPPGWRIVDQVEENRLERQAIQMLLSEDDETASRNLVHLMDKGSTTRRVSSMMLDCVTDLYEIYLATDESAWIWLPQTTPLDEAGLQSACEALATIDIENKSFEKAHAKSIELISDRQWKEFLSKGIAAKLLAGETTFSRKPLSSELRAAYQPLVDHAVALEVRTVANQNEGTYRFLERFDTAYRRNTRRQRAVPIGDATRILATMLERDETDLNRHVPFAMDSPIDHLLLDEFQDTSLQQWQVLKPLAVRITQHSPHDDNSTSGDSEEKEQSDAGRSFFCVGDTKQAIYGWRGGLIDIFDNLHNDLDGIVEQELSASYRSSMVIIDAVNRVMSNLKSHGHLQKAEHGVARFQKQFLPHKTHVSKPGYVRLQTAPEPQEDEGTLEANLRATVELVAERAPRIGELTIGILVRRNQCIGPIIRGLREKGIGASEEGGNPLTDSNAVRAILSLMKLVDHPNDRIARFHLASTPLGKALQYDDFNNTSATLELARTLRQRLLGQGYGLVIAELANSLRPHCSQREQTRLRQFTELATSYQSRSDLRTSHFLQYVNATRVDDPLAAQVRVMTIHQAKGLQFDMVVLPDLESSLIGKPPRVAFVRDRRTLRIQRVSHWVRDELRPAFPPIVQQMASACHSQSAYENVCALYVAMTRAARALHMIVSAKNLRTRGHFAPTMAGLVANGLAPDAEIAPDRTLYASDDRNDRWHEPSRPAETIRPEVSSSPLVSSPRHITLKATSPKNLRGLDTASPSGLEGGPVIELRNTLGLESAGAMQFGTLTHAWLEEIEWLETGLPSSRRMLDIARQLDTGQVDIEQSRRRFGEIAKQPEVERLLRQADYLSTTRPLFSKHLQATIDWDSVTCEVRNEQRIAARDDRQILSGSIDRLVLWKTEQRIVAADIIDFKTDFLPRGDDAFLEDKLDYYRPQLAAYRKAIAKMLRLDPDCLLTRLCFVGAGIVRQV